MIDVTDTAVDAELEPTCMVMSRPVPTIRVIPLSPFVTIDGTTHPLPSSPGIPAKSGRHSQTYVGFPALTPVQFAAGSSKQMLVRGLQGLLKQLLWSTHDPEATHCSLDRHDTVPWPCMS